MVKVTLYTRVRCHLCDDAKAVIETVRAEHPFDFEVIDIDTMPELVQLYTHEVPVVAVD
jgi:glutaredoxin